MIWNKQKVVYPYNEILFTNKKNKVLIYTTTQMNLENMQSEKSQHKRPYAVWFHLFEMFRAGESIEIGSHCKGWD